MKAVPPLHEIPDISVLTKGDEDKLLFYKQFLMAYMEEIRGSKDAKPAQTVSKTSNWYFMH